MLIRWPGRLSIGATFVLILLYAAPAVAEEAARVAAAPVERADIVDRVRLTGTVVASRSARVSTDVGGLVQSMKVDLGDRVGQGDPLVQLDAALERLELRRAEAATREAGARLDDAERRLEDGRRLAARASLPQNELEARGSAVEAARAVAERLAAEEAYRAERVRRHLIAAPFDGVVARERTEAGEWVSPGDPVVDLVGVDRLRVDVPVPQRYFPDLRDDTAITLRADVLGGRAVPAKVLARVPVSDPTARTFTLRLRPVGDGLPLTPGMSVRVVLRLATGERGLVVPRDAVIRHPDGRVTVWVVQEGDGGPQVAERQVRLGQAFDGRVHVLSGLDAGARAVVRGNESLRPGQRVRVVGAGKPSAPASAPGNAAEG
ncbi:hypothetical protein C882_0229 [Caenispirillum salinarum AK4]|uniref:Uncharacterized protein n=1 Tax=Caenispirillum salinarum AK4 TaxID=1238182 RepID=K9GYF7_9PROT|nr:efflux RND transporter periplasmic adaptor subunit [Caenispirillum salinarum]EKV29799.1 hypothetical protein C882_0229 [Caenispirillum salinarum AK4]